MHRGAQFSRSLQPVCGLLRRDARAGNQSRKISWVWHYDDGELVDVIVILVYLPHSSPLSKQANFPSPTLFHTITAIEFILDCITWILT